MMQDEIDKIEEIETLSKLRGNYLRQKIYYEYQVRVIDQRMKELTVKKMEGGLDGVR